jgi:hypothetical protein
MAGSAGKKHEVPHHFDSARQQAESNKLGMWLFLSTEIMMFGGLFCGYAVYRSNHLEIFIYAHQFLDKTLGGLNTLILICSSFTMAWAVRCAQTGNRKSLVVLLIITILCACGFMAVKGVEYEQKWKHGLLWGTRYKPVEHGAEQKNMKDSPVSTPPVKSVSPIEQHSGDTEKDAAPAGAKNVRAMNPYDDLIRIRSDIAPMRRRGWPGKQRMLRQSMAVLRKMYIFSSGYIL